LSLFQLSCNTSKRALFQADGVQGEMLRWECCIVFWGSALCELPLCAAEQLANNSSHSIWGYVCTPQICMFFFFLSILNKKQCSLAFFTTQCCVGIIGQVIVHVWVLKLQGKSLYTQSILMHWCVWGELWRSFLLFWWYSGPCCSAYTNLDLIPVYCPIHCELRM